MRRVDLRGRLRPQAEKPRRTKSGKLAEPRERECPLPDLDGYHSCKCSPTQRRKCRVDAQNVKAGLGVEMRDHWAEVRANATVIRRLFIDDNGNWE